MTPHLTQPDVVSLIDLTSLIKNTSDERRAARNRLVDAVDCLFFEGSLGICSVRDRLSHRDWAETVAMLEEAAGSDPDQHNAARRALRLIHQSALGPLDDCADCEKHDPNFRHVARRIREVSEKTETISELPDAGVAIGRLHLALRAEPGVATRQRQP